MQNKTYNQTSQLIIYKKKKKTNQRKPDNLCVIVQYEK